LKKGGPTVILLPFTSSERIGKSVPHSTENAIPTNRRLLKRNAASRLSTDSSWISAWSSDHRVYKRVNARMHATTRNARKKYPTLD
jgi:hypothetical protein